MRKTSVYLSDFEAESLRRAAIVEGRSQSELIREGVRRIVAELEGRPRQFRSMGKGHGPAYSPWTADELLERRLGRR